MSESPRYFQFANIKLSFGRMLPSDKSRIMQKCFLFLGWTIYFRYLQDEITLRFMSKLNIEGIFVFIGTLWASWFHSEDVLRDVFFCLSGT